MLEDVPLQVGKFSIPCDFIVRVMEEDSQIPIILGQPFLATAGAMIDVKNERLSLHVGEEKLEFNLSKVTASPSLEDACYHVDVIKEVVLQKMGPLNSPSGPLEACLLGTIDKRLEVQPGDEREVYAHILDMAPVFPPQHHPREILNSEVRHSKDNKKCSPKVELKPLHSHLRYEFLNPNETFLVIVNARLNGTQITKLLSVLRKYRGAIGYSIDDTKGISPSFCMRCILLDDEHRPSRQP